MSVRGRRSYDLARRSLFAQRLQSARRPVRCLERGLVETLEDRRLLSVAAVSDLYQVVQENPIAVVAPGVLANDELGSGNELTVSSNTNPMHGSLSVAPDGSFTYTPTAGYIGPDSFTYTATDGVAFDQTTVTLDVVASPPAAPVSSGPRLLSVDSTKGALLDGLLSGLLGTSLGLDAADYDGLAQSELEVEGLVEGVRVIANVGSADQALAADVTLSQLFSASADAAQAQSDTALATLFDDLAIQVAGLTQTIKLGDLLDVDLNDGGLANVGVNASNCSPEKWSSSISVTSQPPPAP